jgi:hypothetical protein
MIFESIYKELVDSFGDLWKYKERGKSLEIITPYATTSHKFISIFLTERDGLYIVSDGGWISEGIYDNSFDRSIPCFEKIFLHYEDAFSIKKAKNLSGGDIFYKSVVNQYSIPSLIFDLSNFISTIISMSHVEFSDKDNEIEQNFSRKAKDYIEKIHPKKEWYFNEYVDKKKEVKVSAILRRENSKLVLLNFITGSHYTYFRSNIGKTNMLFELADKTDESQFIEQKVALLDTGAKGYSPEHWSIWLNHLLSNTNSKKIEWSQKEELEKI